MRWDSTKGAWYGCIDSENAAVNFVVKCVPVYVLLELLLLRQIGCGTGKNHCLQNVSELCGSKLSGVGECSPFQVEVHPDADGSS